MQSSRATMRTQVQALAWVWVMSSILLCASLAVTVRAADEDTSSSVYLVFDPETGDFITSDSPEHALPSDTGLLEGPQSQAPDDAVATQERGTETETAALPAASSGAGLVVALGAAAILGAGVFLFLRRRRVVGSDGPV